MIASSITTELPVTDINDLAKASNAPTVEPACAKMVASAMMIITTAEISADFPQHAVDLLDIERAIDYKADEQAVEHGDRRRLRRRERAGSQPAEDHARREQPPDCLLERGPEPTEGRPAPCGRSRRGARNRAPAPSATPGQRCPERSRR